MHPPTILIVDDNDAVRRSLRDWLSLTFPDVSFLEAVRGEEALGHVQQAAPNIILMDLALPGISGVDAVSQIRSLAPDIPIVVISIHETPEHIAGALQAGARAFIPKRRVYADLIPLLEPLVADLLKTPRMT